MEPAINRLVLKANRSLGSQLALARLLSPAQIEAANETFVTRLREGEVRAASLLRVLLFDLQVLSENDLIAYQLENSTVGGLHLDAYQVQDEVVNSVSLAECAATWTLPVDHWHGTTILATAYHLSDFVRIFWEDRIEGPVAWMITPFGQLDAFFEKREEALRQNESTSMLP
jgi:hypothetical protein